MEASDATQGTTAEAQGTETEDGQEETQAPQFDPTALDQRFEEMQQSLAGLIESRLPEQGEPEQEQQDPVYVNPETGELIDQYGNPVEPDQFDPQQFEQELERRVEQRVEERLAPIFERFEDEDLSKLEEKYPALRTKEGAAPVIQAAQAQAERLARGNPELAESLIRDSGFIETIYLAEQARARAEQETPAGAQTNASLENGSVSQPGEPQMGTWERIQNQQQQSGIWGRS